MSDQKRGLSLITALKKLLFEGYWRWMVWILLFELWLAYSIPPMLLSDYPMLRWLVDALGQVAPVIGKIDGRFAAHPEAVRFYLALTLLLMAAKVAFFYIWLNSDRTGIYRYLVVSPLTSDKPMSGGEFITDPLHTKDKNPRPQKPRSMFSRVFWSILILGTTIGIAWATLDFGSPNSSNREVLDTFRALGLEGMPMYWEWTIEHSLFLSFLLAVSISILRDCALLSARYGCGLVNLFKGKNHE